MCLCVFVVTQREFWIVWARVMRLHVAYVRIFPYSAVPQLAQLVSAIAALFILMTCFPLNCRNVKTVPFWATSPAHFHAQWQTLSPASPPHPSPGCSLIRLHSFHAFSLDSSAHSLPPYCSPLILPHSSHLFSSAARVVVRWACRGLTAEVFRNEFCPEAPLERG